MTITTLGLLVFGLPSSIGMIWAAFTVKPEGDS